MAGLENLTNIIYHEKQQSGSMLCAQHALNNLLQGPYFTAPDLAEIAREVDTMEEEYHTERERGNSRNMDDTGFFSVQVLERAIGVWGLNLVRWRSNSMRPYHDRPHAQLAFILNLEQHWFTLRRFGPASPKLNENVDQGHWFNLNSFLSSPEWVGKLYLGMVLQQAEAEGYSVFAVTQADPSAPLALARTEADEIASTLPEPARASRSTIHNPTKRDLDPISQKANQKDRENEFENAEDDDHELQAAIQASLAYKSLPDDLSSWQGETSSSRTTSATASSSSEMSRSFPTPPLVNEEDPVSASMARNRAMLARMRAEQEAAQRELNLDAFHEQRRAQEEEEEEMMRRVIAESEALARQGAELSTNGAESPEERSDSPRIDSEAPHRFWTAGERNYDDEDPELQAALKASLESLPPGYEHRQFSPPPAPRHPPLGPVPTFEPASGYRPSENTANNQRSDNDMGIDEDGDADMDSESESNVPDSDGKGTPAPEQLSAPPSLEEIRRARLARFGS